MDLARKIVCSLAYQLRQARMLLRKKPDSEFRQDVERSAWYAYMEAKITYKTGKSYPERMMGE